MVSRGGVTYVVVEESLTWLESVGKCRLLGGNLAVIDNQQDFELMREMLLELHASGQNRGWAMWVDGTDSLTSDVWYCVSRQSNCPYIFWSSAVTAASDKHCACVRADRPYAGGMAECTCADSYYPLCEF